MDAAFFELILILVLCLGLYKYFTRGKDIFKRRGVAFDKPIFPFGNLFGLISRRENGFDFFQKLYDKFNDEK